MHLKDFNSATHSFVDHAVVCFIVKEDKILLIHKLRGLGKGKINGPGGKIEEGETPLEAAIRETQEEVGLTPLNLEEMGEIFFYFTDGYSMHGHIFLATDYKGTPTNSDEAIPFWNPISQIPYEKMWEDDIEWLPHILTGRHFIASFLFDNDTMIEKELLFVDENR